MKTEKAAGSFVSAKKTRSPDVTSRQRRRRWLMRLLGVATPLILLVIAECLFAVFDWGHDTELVIVAPNGSEQKKYQFNPHAEQPYFGAFPLKGPEERRFDLPKPKGLFRIIVLGASTIASFPYPPELAFPKHLELALQLQNGNRHLRVEVLNAGITSVGSFSVADLVKQALDADPDLFIIHTGHNEFYCPGGAASSTGSISAKWYPVLTTLRRPRLVQVIGSWFDKPLDPQKQLTELLAANVEIPLDDPLVSKAESNYRLNLERILDVARDAKIPVLLTSVSCNLRDQSPIRTLSPSGISNSQRQQWKQLFEEATLLDQQSQHEASLDTFQKAAAIFDGSAILHYRKAQCLSKMGRWEQARTAFQQARDLDGCRFRAPSSFRKIVRDVAEGANDNSVYFVDIPEELYVLSQNQPPGHNFFLEHVHYNLEGHWQVGLILAKSIQAEILNYPWDAKQVPDAAQRDELLGILTQDRLAGFSFALMMQQTPPFTGAVDVNEHKAFFLKRIQDEFSKLSPVEQNVFSSLPTEVMDRDLLKSLALKYRDAGLYKEWMRMCEVGVKRRPWSAEAHFDLARSRFHLGDRTGALESAKIARDLSPTLNNLREYIQRLER